MDLLTEFKALKKKIESVAMEFHNDRLLYSANNCENLLKESLEESGKDIPEDDGTSSEELKGIDLQEVIEQMRDGVIIFNSGGKILIWNSGAEAITGMKAGKVIGRSLPEVQYELLWGNQKNKEFINERFNEVVKFSNPEIFNTLLENIIYVPEKGIRNIQALIFPVYLKKNRWVFGSAIRDITEIKKIENQLRELNGMKDKVFSIIAHDLRSPFNNIIAVSHLLMEHIDVYDKDTIRKFIEQISLTAEPTLNILDNLLHLAVSLNSQIYHQNEQIKLKEVFEDIINNQSNAARIKNVSLSHTLEEDLYVNANPHLFKALLRNLVNNAVKFTPSGGKVELNAKEFEDRIQVEVSDTGIGMEKEKVKRLFSINTSDTTSGTEGEKGSGIGLILCREIVQKFNGNIWAESEPGKGSRFVFTIPKNSH